MAYTDGGLTIERRVCFLLYVLIERRNKMNLFTNCLIVHDKRAETNLKNHRCQCYMLVQRKVDGKLLCLSEQEYFIR